MSYDFNPEAERIAQGVIERWHSHLTGVAIAYITKSGNDKEGSQSLTNTKAPRGGKALKLGSAASVSEKYQLIATKDYEFIIELNGQYWDRLELDQQEALIDHELCHCRKDADGFYLADHDLEEFRQIVRRHGFWKPDIQAFCEEAQPLFEKPGVQRRFTTLAPTGDVVVCGGQEVRVEETGDLWTYDVKSESFVRLNIGNTKCRDCGDPSIARDSKRSYFCQKHLSNADGDVVMIEPRESPAQAQKRIQKERDGKAAAAGPDDQPALVMGGTVKPVADKDDMSHANRPRGGRTKRERVN